MSAGASTLAAAAGSPYMVPPAAAAGAGQSQCNGTGGQREGGLEGGGDCWSSVLFSFRYGVDTGKVPMVPFVISRILEWICSGQLRFTGRGQADLRGRSRRVVTDARRYRRSAGRQAGVRD